MDSDATVDLVELVDNQRWPVLLADLLEMRQRQADELVSQAVAGHTTKIHVQGGVVHGLDMVIRHLRDWQEQANTARTRG